MITVQTQLIPNAVRNLKGEWSSTSAGLSPRPVSTRLPHSLKGWTIWLRPQECPVQNRSPRLELLAELAPWSHSSCLHPASSTESKAPHTAAIYRAEGSHHPWNTLHLGAAASGDFWRGKSHCKPKPLWPSCRGQTTAFLLISSEATQRCVSTSAYLTESSQKGFKWWEKLLFLPLVWSGLFCLQAVNLIKSLPTK